ncbi:MAG TPA: VCBS repeat-containing protein [Bryobacteraceae bacterium]|nr:VCBS repeat-containing protein [Bryobacteraceae bacterium]
MIGAMRVMLAGATAAAMMAAAGGGWTHLSSRKGELPVPGESHEQTGALVAKIDPRGRATDFVLSFRQKAPALVWYRRQGKGWSRYVIEKEFLTVEAGGTAYDIDGDGDLDVVFGGDYQSSQLWWWENPAPRFDPAVSWKRHVIKDGGARQHHDQIFADLKGTGKPQLVFWNQGAKTLYLAEIPADPRNSGPWPLEVIFSGKAGEQVENAAQYAEGLDVSDVDGDGRLDLLAGNSWFRYEGGGRFRPVRIGTIGGRIKAGKFHPGRYPQIVIAPGDGSGPLKFYECAGDPGKPESWRGGICWARTWCTGIRSTWAMWMVMEIWTSLPPRWRNGERSRSRRMRRRRLGSCMAMARAAFERPCW